MTDNLVARIQSIESCGAVDGPGLRYVVFFQGCQFKCRYCHNRDTWNLNGGFEKSLDEMLKEIKSYLFFYKPNKGGVTASGGEATLQMEFVTNLFSEAKKLNLTTCLDTNGCISRYDQKLESLLSVTDLVMLDIKHMNEQDHLKLTKVTNKYTLEFAKYLAQKKIHMWIRYVVVPNWSDQDENVHALGKFITENIKEYVDYVDILPYHELGKHKWKEYQDHYDLDDVKPPTAEKLTYIRNILKNEYGLSTR